MLSRWWRGWLRRREEQALRRRAIPDDLWHRTLVRYPFLTQLPAADQVELRRLSSLFLHTKEFTGIDGFEVNDDIAVAIAAQACLPVLRMGLTPYRGFVGIVLHADEVVAHRIITDEVGIVHDYDEVLTGEAMEGGPVMLSWPDVRDAGELAASSYNVVIHEFAHVLDMLDGAADGIPALPSSADRGQWQAVMRAEYKRFCRQVARGAPTLLDPYGAEAPSEFFAVAVEAFFVNSSAMKKEQPALYRLLSGYFLQDPAAHLR